MEDIAIKKLVGFVFLIFFFVAACDKKVDQVIPNPPPPPPPPPQAEITVKFSALPPDCIGFFVDAFGFFEESGQQATNNLKDEVKYPEFTYKFSVEFTEKYLGKKSGSISQLAESFLQVHAGEWR